MNASGMSAPSDEAVLELVAAYGKYMREERRLAPITVHNCEGVVRRFLLGRADGADVSTLDVAEVRRVVLHEARRLSPGATRAFTGALRPFLRFLFATTDALLAAPDPTTFLGRRDHLLLLVAVETGMRVSELTALTCGDTTPSPAAVVHCHGKGRKDRTTPLRTPVARALQSWIRDRGAAPGDPLFPTRFGGHLSTDAVADLLAKHLKTAAPACPSLATKHVTPHALRHTTAMRLLHAGTDTSVIALWLGHATTASTQPYLHADLTLKEQALARTAPNAAARARFRPDDTLLAFLEDL